MFESHTTIYVTDPPLELVPHSRDIFKINDAKNVVLLQNVDQPIAFLSLLSTIKYGFLIINKSFVRII